MFPSSSKYSRDLLKHQDPESSPVSLLFTVQASGGWGVMVLYAGLPRCRITSLQTNLVLGVPGLLVIGSQASLCPMDAGSRAEPGGLLSLQRLRDLLGMLAPAAG